MNQEKLNYIASQPSEISTEDARELEELTRNFPYFTLPFVLLTKYYACTNDYRFEDTLHKTALRVNDRAWLHAFIHSQPSLDTEVSVSLNIEPETENPSAISKANEVEITEEDIATAEIVKEDSPVVEISVPYYETAVEQPATDSLEIVPESIPSPFPEDSGLMDTLELTSVGSMIEFDLSPPETEIEEFPVYEEIVSFDEKIDTELNSPTHTVEDFQGFELRELIIEPDKDTNLQKETPSPKPEEIEEMLPEPVIRETDPNSVFPLFTAGSVYNIEDYYPATSNNQAPFDFFSWLSNPEYKSQSEESHKEEVVVSHKAELIDNFIKNKPGVSQPKSDFFNAIDVAKRSDSLPAGLATETLASVYMQQGNFTGAIRIYEALVLKIPQKSAYFAALIEKIKKEHL